MKIRKIEVLNQDTHELEPAEQLVCDCGATEFIVYSLGENHTHLQCVKCDKPHCSKHPELENEVPIKTIADKEGFCE